MVNTLSSSGQGPMAVPACISIGILAWNEEEAIGLALQSLFRQSLFPELSRRHSKCEVFCVANGCTDQTAAIASAIFQEQTRAHPFQDAFSCRTCDLRERGTT